jgi:2'-5' RNA ligase
VLWAGVDGDLAVLGRLQQSVDEAIAAPGLGFAKERRPFRPHLTLGRVRDGVSTTASQKIGAAITEAPPVTACSWPAEEIHLIRSTLTPQGAIYTSLGSAPLAGKE